MVRELGNVLEKDLIDIGKLIEIIRNGYKDVFVCLYVCLYRLVCMFVCMSVCMYILIHIHVCVYVFVDKHHQSLHQKKETRGQFSACSWLLAFDLATSKSSFQLLARYGANFVGVRNNFEVICWCKNDFKQYLYFKVFFIIVIITLQRL